MNKQWKFKEGIAFCCGIMVLGLVLQLCTGPVKWSLVAWPANLIILLIYILGLTTIYALRKKVYFFRWMMHYTAAVPAVGIGALATMLYGLTNWEGTLSFWSFVLLYLWITTIVGLTTIKQIGNIIKQMTNSNPAPHAASPFPLGKLSGALCGALISHLGLFISIVCATLGHADFQRLKMITYVDEPEWRAFDSDTKKVETLDLAVQLNKFTLEEYPAHGDMPPMPRRFASDVTVFTKDGQKVDATIEVNKPLEVNGWHIYQYSYDTASGKDSETSVFELVRDPWLPYVFAGIYMLIAGAVLMMMSRWKLRWIWTFALFVLAVCGIAYIFNEHEKTKELMPALQSPWFAPHVAIYMVCYTVLGIATIMAICYLISPPAPEGGARKEVSSTKSQQTRGNSHLGGWRTLDHLVYVGTALMTIGMLFGALWAKEAWGHYWAWDPKETWAAATWFLYLTYIHFRLIKPDKFKFACILLIFTYCCLQMCWWGINYLPSVQGNSVHTYDLSK